MTLCFINLQFINGKNKESNYHLIVVKNEDVNKKMMSAYYNM